MDYFATFTMSEAQAARFPDWETRELSVALGTLGAQLTYEQLRECQTGATIATYGPAGGYWRAEADDREYSDVVVHAC